MSRNNKASAAWKDPPDLQCNFGSRHLGQHHVSNDNIGKNDSRPLNSRHCIRDGNGLTAFSPENIDKGICDDGLVIYNNDFHESSPKPTDYFGLTETGWADFTEIICAAANFTVAPRCAAANFSVLEFSEAD